MDLHINMIFCGSSSKSEAWQKYLKMMGLVIPSTKDQTRNDVQETRPNVKARKFRVTIETIQ